jgi:HPt (histidine-containing phosphotransfer) domain-containing protein
MSEALIIDQTIMSEARAMMKAKFPTMVQYFLEDAATYIADIRAGIDEKSVEKIISPAHTMKSSSRQMGAMRLSDIAKDIEHLARDQLASGGDIMLFVSMLAALEHAMLETKTAFEAMET